MNHLTISIVIFEHDCLIYTNKLICKVISWIFFYCRNNQIRNEHTLDSAMVLLNVGSFGFDKRRERERNRDGKVMFNMCMGQQGEKFLFFCGFLFFKLMAHFSNLLTLCVLALYFHQLVGWKSFICSYYLCIYLIASVMLINIMM